MSVSQLKEHLFIILKLDNGCVILQEDMVKKISSSSITATYRNNAQSGANVAHSAA